MSNRSNAARGIRLILIAQLVIAAILFGSDFARVLPNLGFSPNAPQLTSPVLPGARLEVSTRLTFRGSMPLLAVCFPSLLARKTPKKRRRKNCCRLISQQALLSMLMETLTLPCSELPQKAATSRLVRF